MNIYDIAREAGVSISTVSRVLNNKGNVNENTRKNVMEILQKHNYTPSAIARGMVSKSMRTVAVLTVDIRVPHYARTAYTIEREFSRRGYEVTLCNTGGELAETEKYLRTVSREEGGRPGFGGIGFQYLMSDAGDRGPSSHHALWYLPMADWSFPTPTPCWWTISTGYPLR